MNNFCRFALVSFLNYPNLFLNYSSLLIVYEGEIGSPRISILGPDSFINTSESCCDDTCTQASEDNTRDIFCYDADTSNSSVEYLSHDELSQDSHEKSFGEAAARGAKSSPFYPIPEDTVFLNSAPSFSINTSSSTSIDSWMAFSNSSSDDCSLPEHLNSSSSSEDTSDLDLSHHKSKRKCGVHFAVQLEEVENDLLPSLNKMQKRLCVDVSSDGDDQLSNVDLRIIDFAHTSFTRKSDIDTKSIHQGPDGGFLTGLDSLKHLLLQIMAADNVEF